MTIHNVLTRPNRDRRAIRGGFTLIELLVVIAVIAVVIGMMLPALGRARWAARGTLCASHLREIAAANHLYAAANRDLLAPHSSWTLSVKNSGGGWGVNQEWSAAYSVRAQVERSLSFGLLANYLSESFKVGMCPAYRLSDAILANSRISGTLTPVFVNYGYNGYLLGEKHPNFDTNSERTIGYRTWVGYALGSIPRASSVVMFADSGWRVGTEVAPQPDLSPPIAVNFSANLKFTKPVRAAGGPSVHGRHERRAAVAWVDGHVDFSKVTVYPDQPAEDQRFVMGYVAPEQMPGDLQRDNGFMFVR